MKTIPALSVFIVITSLAAIVSGQTTTNPTTGYTTTTSSSDKYGPGGKHETISDKNYQVLYDRYYDKCGRLRESHSGTAPISRYDEYWDENGKNHVTHRHDGDVYINDKNKVIDSKEGKALIEKLEKTPSAPCPEKTATAPEHPKAKPELPGGAFSPSLTPLAEPQTFNWTGPYVGIQFGYTLSSSDYSLKLGGLWNDFPDARNEIEFRGMHEFDENGFGLGGCAG